jgi:hypothetical protein
MNDDDTIIFIFLVTAAHQLICSFYILFDDLPTVKEKTRFEMQTGTDFIQMQCFLQILVRKFIFWQFMLQPDFTIGGEFVLLVLGITGGFIYYLLLKRVNYLVTIIKVRFDFCFIIRILAS